MNPIDITGIEFDFALYFVTSRYHNRVTALEHQNAGLSDPFDALGAARKPLEDFAAQLRAAHPDLETDEETGENPLSPYLTDATTRTD
jgi:hypothetical protein